MIFYWPPGKDVSAKAKSGDIADKNYWTSIMRKEFSNEQVRLSILVLENVYIKNKIVK